MRKTIKLSEKDLTNIVKRIIREQNMMDEYSIDRKEDLETILAKVHKMLGMGAVTGIESKEEMAEHGKKMLEILKKHVRDMKHLELELKSSLFGIGMNA